MLMRNPKEFERVASEWAIKYAGAPKKDRGETSGGATTETLKKQQKKTKEQEEAERAAQYVSIHASGKSTSNKLLGTEGIILE